MYIDCHFASFFWEKSWKNEWSKIDPESFQEGSQSFRTSKNIMKHNFNWPWAFRKKFKNSTKTCHSEKFWDSVLSFSSCWRMCCLAAGLEGNLEWLVEHMVLFLISAYLWRRWMNDLITGIYETSKLFIKLNRKMKSDIRKLFSAK